MSPCDRSLWVTDHQLEHVKNLDLIRYCFVNRPSPRGVRGSCQSETARKHEKARERVSHVACRVWTSGRYIPVAIEKQSPVPVCRDFNQISCAVRKCSGLRGDASLCVCGAGNGEQKDGCERQIKDCSLGDSLHSMNLLLQNSDCQGGSTSPINRNSLSPTV